MADIEEVKYSLELPIGTRFYYLNSLLEVETDDNLLNRCSKCKFQKGILITPMCYVMNCDKHERHDGKYVYFKKVEEKKRENNEFKR